MFQSARLLVVGNGDALLFWRREIEFDEGYVDDALSKKVLRIRARLAIPGVDLGVWEAPWVKERRL
jgi:hypothetical protein